ncbi:MAG: hypothetical protein HWD59_05025 [Coxiellaceae bacterium]|nr:MAG: hypothetical protein HWD59_05025 [Coxiellaceae bacterium]
MKITKLYTAEDNKSYFMEEEIDLNMQAELGAYSAKFAATGILFREFVKGKQFDWHNAPQPQYIVYLTGEVEVIASGGEKRIFKSGDILFATDLTGQGHITTTLTEGKSVIITTQ